MPAAIRAVSEDPENRTFQISFSSEEPYDQLWVGPEILDHSEVYSGVYARVSISFYAYNVNGSKGIACGLNNIQKVKDGKPFGGRSRAEDDFADADDDDDDGDEDFLS